MASSKRRISDPVYHAEPTELMAALGHRFKDETLLEMAVTHASVAARRGEVMLDYQRMEFLGDRVLGLVIADLLYRRFPDEPEGKIARRHATLVRQEALVEVAEALELSRYLRLGTAEEQAGERNNPALLADACEALLGALYLDGGYPVALDMIETYWTPLVAADARPPSDPKSGLQEWTQGRAMGYPSYRHIGRDGPEHNPVFNCEVSVPGYSPMLGQGRTKKAAEREAARLMLDRLVERTASAPDAERNADE